MITKEELDRLGSHNIGPQLFAKLREAAHTLWVIQVLDAARRSWLGPTPYFGEWPTPERREEAAVKFFPKLPEDVQREIGERPSF